MKLTSLLVVMLAFVLVGCGKPTAPESPNPDSYGLTHEGEAPEGRNELQE